MKKIFLTLVFVGLIGDLFACLILFVTDGRNILVGNHEDWYAQDAEITFIPANGKKLGMVYFDFHSEKSAQGGMNTAGLFFDGTRTPFAPYAENKHKEDCNCYLWTKILEECRSVDQAIGYIQKYRIPEIEDVHVLFADSLGNSAVIGVYKNKLQIHRRTRNYQLVTNFNLSDPAYGDEPVCKRFAKAEEMLGADSSATLANVEKILSNTHQEALTVYSNVYDLSRREVYVYTHTNFTRKARFVLSAELKKGRHTVRSHHSSGIESAGIQ